MPEDCKQLFVHTVILVLIICPLGLGWRQELVSKSTPRVVSKIVYHQVKVSTHLPLDYSFRFVILLAYMYSTCLVYLNVNRHGH